MTADAFGVTAAGWLEEEILRVGADKVAAFIAEPVQGAGGAIIPPDTYWPEVQRICRKYDVLLIVDEVISGFGRTGSWFGIGTYGIAPDVMQLAKGLTSGYAPLSATILSDRLAKALIELGGEWYHGFTFSGHPVSCAVANANIRILRGEKLIERAAAEIVPHFRAHVAALADHPLVGDVRSVGLFAGIQLVRDRAGRKLFDEELQVGETCSAIAMDRGLALRAIGDTLALMPPLVITREQLDTLFSLTRQSLDETARRFGAMR
jgi:putrescine aminotransferase